MKIKIISLFVLFSLLITAGFGCKKSDDQAVKASQPITLEYWRVFDGSDAFSEIITDFKNRYPHITIRYRQLRYEEYETELLNAFAEDRGPDIFSIGNTWLRKYEAKLAPMPDSTTMVIQVLKSGLKKEVVPEIRTSRSPSLKEIKNNFADVVYEDMVIDNKVYGLPLYIDTLALFYNRDLFNNAGLIEPPKYWNNQMQQDVKALSKQDLRANILQSGIALGGANNIERVADIVSVLMMQNGTQMLSLNGAQVTFNLVPKGGSQAVNYNPGLAALNFYLDFSNPGKEVYSWNASSTSAVEAFASGQLAMMLSYSYNLPIIKSKAPKLNFDVAPLPQVEGSTAQVNFANYFAEVVSKKSKYQNEAWSFVQFVTQAEQAKKYLAKTKKPSALRAIVAEQRNDDDLAVFANQVLTAKSWYRGYNPLLMEEAMAEMVTNALNNPEKIIEAMNLAAQKISQTLRK